MSPITVAGAIAAVLGVWGVMSYDTRALLKGVAVVTGVVVVATGLTWAARFVADETMYVFFVGAVAFATWMGGLAVGLGTIVASMVAVDFAFIEPVGRFQVDSITSIARLLSFALVAAMIAALTSALTRARREAEHLARAADQAKSEAQAASAAKSDFLSTLSHEVRTPINALLGYADLLDAGAAGALTDAQAGFVGRLRDAAQHLLTVVNEVLEVAKADAGRLAVDMVPVVAAPVIEAAVSLVLPQATSKRVGMVVRSLQPVVRFSGDADRVREVVVNLLSNAVKFAPEGSRVEITAGRGGDGPTPPLAGNPAGLVWICVADHGPGIPRADQRRIFEPFMQSGNGGAGERRGTGLGLAISRRLSRLMGGDLVVESELGEGASFTVWLRAA